MSSGPRHYVIFRPLGTWGAARTSTHGKNLLRSLERVKEASCQATIPAIPTSLGFHELRRGNAQAVAIPVEEHILAFAIATLGGFDPLTHSRTLPQTAKESPHPAFGITAVVVTHDGLDRFRRFVGMIKGNGANVVVEDMSLYDSVEEMWTNGPEVPVNGGSCTSREVPRFGFVVREGWVSVLEVGDGD